MGVTRRRRTGRRKIRRKNLCLHTVHVCSSFCFSCYIYIYICSPDSAAAHLRLYMFYCWLVNSHYTAPIKWTFYRYEEGIPSPMKVYIYLHETHTNFHIHHPMLSCMYFLLSISKQIGKLFFIYLSIVVYCYFFLQLPPIP